jgi:WD40 repeat protein
MTGRELLSFSPGVWLHPEATIGFSPDGKQIAAVVWDPQAKEQGSLKFWDATTGMPIRSLDCREALAFSRDWQRMVTEKRLNGDSRPSFSRAMSVLDSEGRQELLCIPAYESSAILSPNGRLLAAESMSDRGSLDGGWAIWDTINRQKICVIQGSSRQYRWTTIEPGLFSPDGQRLALLKQNGRTELWDTTTGKQEASYKGPAELVRRCQAFSPDGQLFASAYDNQTVMIWSTRTGEPVRTFRGVSSPRSLCFTSDQQGLAVCSTDGVLKVWDVMSDQEGRTLEGKEDVLSIAFSPKGLLLAIANLERVEVYSAQTGQKLFFLTAGKPIVNSVAFSPDGRLLAAISLNGMLKVWDIVTQREVINVQAHESRAYSKVFFIPNQQQVISLGAESLEPAGETDTQGRPKQVHKVEAKLWDLATGRVIHTIPVGTCVDRSANLALSPDGNRLATVVLSGVFGSNGVHEHEIKVWDVATGRELFSQSGPYYSCVFSPDGRLMAVWGQDGVRLWDAETFADIHILRGAREPLAFSPDGKRLASGGGGRRLVGYRVRAGNSVATLPPVYQLPCVQSRWLLSRCQL